MKIDCILTSTNLNPVYCQFIPIFIKMWSKLVPEADIKIILIAETIPENFVKYSEYLILYKPGKILKTEFVSQYIRSLYPSVLNYSGGVLITDMDMLPMNRKYYVDNILHIPDNKFIYYRDVLLDVKEIAMCYNIATPKVWSDIFNINDINDINNQLHRTYSQINYDGLHGGSGWNIDQLDLFERVQQWHNKTGNFINLKDSQTGFLRLDRGNIHLINQNVLNDIRAGRFTDYHALRPYDEYKDINNFIANIICS